MGQRRGHDETAAERGLADAESTGSETTADRHTETGDRADDRRLTRRRAVAAAGTTALVGLAGCSALDFVTGDGPVEFAAETATVSDTALEETGYELNEVRERVFTREVEAAGQSREVEVTNQVAEYDRAVELFGERLQAAVFTALSTPQVRVLGQTFNPVADMDTDELAMTVQRRYDNVQNVERASEYTTDVLGDERTVVQYDADAELADSGLAVDLVIHVMEAIEAGDDFVVCLGAYPEIVGDGDAVRRLLNGVEHPGAE